LLDVKVGDHQASVDTGIGAAGTGDRCRGAQQCSQGLLDDLLHRGIMRLHLPTMEASPPITESHKVPHRLLIYSDNKDNIGTMMDNFYFICCLGCKNVVYVV
jgi:hypothetical protein